MARTKKSNKKNDETPKIIRNYDPMSLEKRLYDLDHAPQRSWDLYAMEKRIYNLEINGGGGGGESKNIVVGYRASSTWSYSKDINTAFNYIANSNMRNPDNAWCSNTNDTTPYIEMYIPDGIELSKIIISVFSNYSGDWTGNIKITGSNDGLTFEDLTDLTSITAPLQVLANVEIPITSKGNYKYYRIQGTSAFSVNNAASIFFDQVEAYT